MRHVVVELSIAVAAAALMASMVMAGGAAIEPAVLPLDLSKRPITLPADHADTCFSAPVTAPWSSGPVGEGVVCDDGETLHATLRVSDLTPDAVYTAWLRFAHPRAVCPEVPCAPTSLLGDSQGGLMEQIGGGVVPSSRTLELQRELRDLRLARGTEVALLLLRPGATAGPHAQAIFTIP